MHEIDEDNAQRCVTPRSGYGVNLPVGSGLPVALHHDGSPDHNRERTSLMAKFTHKLLMAGVASVTLAIAATQAAPARADQTPTASYSRVGAWEIRVDSTLANSCYMTTTYRDGVVRFGYDNPHNSGFLSIKNSAWTSLVDGNVYQLTMQIDNNPPSPFKAMATTDTAGYRGLIMLFGDPENFMSGFGLTSQLRLSYQGREIGRFNLVGTAQGITAMNECNQAYGGPDFAVKQDPFKPTGPARPTAPARQIDPFKTL
jgi:hypothetical protein